MCSTRTTQNCDQPIRKKLMEKIVKTRVINGSHGEYSLASDLTEAHCKNVHRDKKIRTRRTPAGLWARRCAWRDQTWHM